MIRPAPARSPALSVVAPFFLVAPIGLVAAGLLLATSDELVFAGINVPRTVAVTHAAVIGWLTTAIIGAVYQLGPAVLGGHLRSERLARIQLVVHVLSVAGFVWAVAEWHVGWMGTAGIGLIVSFILFFVNAVPAIVRAERRSLTRSYLIAALVMLGVAASVGITWVGTLEHLWFPVTLGRLGGHAHLGLVGWLALVVMGTSYQLVPMFNIVHGRKPRFGWLALAITLAMALTAGFGLMFDPPRPVRMLLAVGLVVGPLLWAADILHLLQVRGRRVLDIQGHATFVSLAFLAVAIVLGLAVAYGSPWLGREDAARWQLAYGIAAIGGWAGITLVGNSYKILSFLTWFHRYRHLAGRQPVPLISDIYNDRWAHVVLGVHTLALVLLLASALFGELTLLRIGGLVLAAAGSLHAVTLGHIVFARHERREAARPLAGVTAQ